MKITFKVKILFFLLFSFLITSCSETVKVACESNDDCDNERICDIESNNCVKCSPLMCNYEHASGICKEDNGRVVCGFGECEKDYYNIDNNEANGCEYSCNISNEEIEICDSVDNNCDGEIDEGLECSCSNNESKDCFVLDTQCEGTKECTDGTWGACLSEDNTVGVEICDGLDNNCDEHIDENFKTGDIYTDNNHCGACNQVCLENNTSKNDCSLEGECEPVCNAGWSDFDGNGLNGCETGCSQEVFEEENHKIISESNTNYTISDSDAFYSNDQMLIVYSKETEFATDISGKIIDKNGNIIKDDTFLTTTPLGGKSVRPKLLVNGIYNYTLYGKYGMGEGGVTISTIELIRKDTNLDLGEVIDLETIDNMYLTYKDLFDLTKKNYIEDKFFIGLEYKNRINIISYTLSTRSLELVKSVDAASNKDNIKAVKITTSNTDSRGRVILAWCKKAGLLGNSSELKLFIMNDDYSGDANLVIDNFTSNNCNDFENTGSITSDGKYSYISYIKENNLIIKKHQYLETDGIIEQNIIKELLTYKTEPTTTSNFLSSSINYENDNLLLAFNKSTTDNAGNTSYSNGYMRFTGRLELKDSNEILSTELPSKLSFTNNNIFYSDQHEVIMKFDTKENIGNNINISKTSACEN